MPSGRRVYYDFREPRHDPNDLGGGMDGDGGDGVGHAFVEPDEEVGRLSSTNNRPTLHPQIQHLKETFNGPRPKLNLCTNRPGPRA